MHIERIFLSGFLTVSCVCFSGYNLAGESHSPIVLQQKSDVEEKKHDPQKTVMTNRKKTEIKRKSETAKPTDIDKDALAKQKPLDLSIPYTDVEKNGLTTTIEDSEILPQTTNIFASENKKKTRPLQLDGRLLMSQEPEAEKQKSADGAGIVINLKP